MSNPPPLAAILGCAGTELTTCEIELLRNNKPLGLILFERNCVSPDQVKLLITSFREVVGREDAPVLIDQEGGRVTRLKPPHWRHAPAAKAFVEITESRGLDVAAKAIRSNYRLIGAELKAAGITVDCAPVLDRPIADADPIIGDRALGGEVKFIKELGSATCAGLLDVGVLPVIKHLPGHGRALVDSHMKLPRVDATLYDLKHTDFEPFRHLASQPLGMTAHVIYSAIDAVHPATISAKVISDVIRGYIGFDGLLISDDLSMKALSGTISERTEAALVAGCDVVLHCNGNISEINEVVAAVSQMTEEAMHRWKGAVEHIRTNGPIDYAPDLKLLQEFSLA